MGWLSDLLRGGGDELGWDDLVRRIVDAIAALRHYGPRGEVAFPDDVIVRITVPEGTTAVVQGFIDRPELTIGRDPACNCVISDSTVSAQHARLVFRQGQWWVEDLRSTNGTYLNQELVLDPLVITSGDHLRCGQAQFVITIQSMIEGKPGSSPELLH